MQQVRYGWGASMRPKQPRDALDAIVYRVLPQHRAYACLSDRQTRLHCQGQVSIAGDVSASACCVAHTHNQHLACTLAALRHHMLNGWQFASASWFITPGFAQPGRSALVADVCGG